MKASSTNPLHQVKAAATRLMNASVRAAENASEACVVGQSPADGRADRAKRRTATQDLKDHWSRAIKATDANDALAELEHAVIAAKEAHGSDEYEQRAVWLIVSAPGSETFLRHDPSRSPFTRTRAEILDTQHVAKNDEAKRLRDCYGADHQMGMIVPKGGSSCGNCAFAQVEEDGPHCLNTCWSKTPKWRGGGGGETHLPVMDPTTYCCDMWQFRSSGT